MTQKELIKVNYDAEQPTVSARDLHEGLEIKSNFTTWFERICEYGFTESDYKKCFPNLESGLNGGQNMVDYKISVDMAKQICMIQRTDKGREYRQYFLDLEKAWNTPEQIMARALKFASQQMDSLKERCNFLGGEIVKQQKVISELQPKADYVDSILNSKSLVLTTQIAKDYGMSARKFNKILHELGVQYKVSDQWVLYSKYQACGYVHSKTYEFCRSNGNPDVRMQTEWTQKGRLFLYELLKQNGYVPIIEKSA